MLIPRRQLAVSRKPLKGRVGKPDMAALDRPLLALPIGPDALDCYRLRPAANG
jgi:hypothetical protein